MLSLCKKYYRVEKIINFWHYPSEISLLYRLYLLFLPTVPAFSSSIPGGWTDCLPVKVHFIEKQPPIPTPQVVT